MLVLAGDRGEVRTFVPGEVLQVRVRDGSKWIGVLEQVEPAFLMLGVRRIEYESIVWLRTYVHSRDVVGKILTGAGAGMVVGGLAIGASNAAEEGASGAAATTLAGLGLGVMAAGVITLATRKKYRTQNFRMLVMDREEAPQ